MKKNNRGFVLAETLVVATFVLTTLMVIYVQFINISGSYQNTFQYNTVNGLYATNNIRDYIRANEQATLKSAFTDSTVSYLDLTDCSTTYLTENSYCQALFQVVNVKQVIFARSDLASLKEKLTEDTHFSEKMKQFIKATPSSKVSEYLILVEFTDSTFATLEY